MKKIVKIFKKEAELLTSHLSLKKNITNIFFTIKYCIV